MTEYEDHKVPDKVPDNLTENQKIIIDFIRRKPIISMSELAAEIGMSKRKILDNINKLRSIGLIERIGPAKGGYWKISQNT
jgi:ATP-dependent DNA helicase RecG